MDSTDIKLHFNKYQTNNGGEKEQSTKLYKLLKVSIYADKKRFTVILGTFCCFAVIIKSYERNSDSTY